jgi:hypothetical protein
MGVSGSEVISGFILVCLKGLSKTAKNLNNDRPYSALHLNADPIAYET